MLERTDTRLYVCNVPVFFVKWEAFIEVVL